MPSVVLREISNHGCHNTTLSVENGEFLVLAGTSGAGKTTLLNVIAGLTPYTGYVTFDGIPVNNLSPARRNVGYLFQEFALFPNLTVRKNIAFGLEARGMEKPATDERVNALLSLLKLGHLESRYPHSLSGGEKQRAALARTLAPHPAVLLLDEPFSNLDPRTAKFLRLELKSLQRQLDLTAVYVTHNQIEAIEMGDRIAVVNRGRIEQIGKPEEIVFSPRSTAVSELFGSPNIFTSHRVEVLDFGLARVTCGRLSLIVPFDGRAVDKIAILPSGVQVSRHRIETPAPNRLKGVILQIHRKSPIVTIDMEVEKTLLTAELPEFVWDETGLQISDPVHLIIPLKWIRVLAS